MFRFCLISGLVVLSGKEGFLPVKNASLNTLAPRNSNSSPEFATDANLDVLAAADPKSAKAEYSVSSRRIHSSVTVSAALTAGVHSVATRRKQKMVLPQKRLGDIFNISITAIAT
jgi:hypothetical protein